MPSPHAVACHDEENIATLVVSSSLSKTASRKSISTQYAEARLTILDAVTLWPSAAARGEFAGRGVDGSIVVFSDTGTNFQWHANLGTDIIVELQKPIIARHEIFIADLYVSSPCR